MAQPSSLCEWWALVSLLAKLGQWLSSLTRYEQEARPFESIPSNSFGSFGALTIAPFANPATSHPQPIAKE